MSNHTPGPWENSGVDCFHDADGFEWVVEAGGEVIAVVCNQTPTDYNHLQTVVENTPEGKANANLIAAAPELLAALKELTAGSDENICILHNTPRAWRMCREAIAKAEG